MGSMPSEQLDMAQQHSSALGQEESLSGDTASAGMLNHGVLVKAPFPF